MASFNNDETSKPFKICSVLGGLDITRLVSSNSRSFFQSAIEDVELIREFVGVAAITGKGIRGGISTLQGLEQTLDWRGRGFEERITTVQANLAYVDDRPDRTMERFVAINTDKPLVGDQETDLAIVNSLNLIFPWIVDRKSVQSKWWTPHQNGQSQGPSKEPFRFESLYTAAFLGTYGEAWAYYPPLSVYGEGSPLTFGDILPNDYNSKQEEFVAPNLPNANPTKQTFFSKPYPDSAVPGLSLITALAPVYMTGTFGNYTYNDTYIASAGIDIAVSSVSTLLDVLEDSLTDNSFGIIVDDQFNIIVISQSSVEKIYPPRTGFEESRVVRDLVDPSIILEDRRNQTYLVSDTILQPLTNLTNGDWTNLLRDVQQVTLGQRGYTTLDIITSKQPDEQQQFYVMFERWQYVANWTLLVFAPTRQVDNAMRVQILRNTTNSNSTDTLLLQGERGSVIRGNAILSNEGSLDATVTLKNSPRWVQIVTVDDSVHTLGAGDRLIVEFDVLTEELEFGSTSSGVISFMIQDDNYPDCFYSQDVGLEISVKTLARQSCPGDTIHIAESCACPSNSVNIGGTDNCVSYGILLSSILLPLIFLLSVIFIYAWVDRKRVRADSVWAVSPKELKFDDPPEVVGRGTFGLVLLAEYRGTKVAVKRVIPPRSTEDQSNSRCQRRASASMFLNIGGRPATISLDPSNTIEAKSRSQESSSGVDATTTTHNNEKTGSQSKNSKTDYRKTKTGFQQRRLSTENGEDGLSNWGKPAANRTLDSDVFNFKDEVDEEQGIFTSNNKYSSMRSITSSNSKNNIGNDKHVAFNSIQTVASHRSGVVPASKRQSNGGKHKSKIWSQVRSRLFHQDEYSKLKAEFVEEMRLLSKLRHPCITTVMGAVINKTSDPMLVMEFMDHGSLYDVLHNDTMVIEGELVLPILRDISAGLRFLHAATPQVIHGDLKAMNGRSMLRILIVVSDNDAEYCSNVFSDVSFPFPFQYLLTSSFELRSLTLDYRRRKRSAPQEHHFGWHPSYFVVNQKMQHHPTCTVSGSYCMKFIPASIHTMAKIWMKYYSKLWIRRSTSALRSHPECLQQ